MLFMERYTSLQKGYKMTGGLDNFKFCIFPSILRDIKRGYKWALHKRRMRVFGVGLPKTGTTSLAAMLTMQGRCRHEAMAKYILPYICSYLRGEISDEVMCKRLRYRIALLKLDVDVTSFLHHFTDFLCEMYPDAKFIFTIRNCYSWVKSIINHMDTRPIPKNDPWVEYRNVRFNSGEGFEPEEKVLERKGLYPIGSFLRHWAEMNLNILSSLPRDRSLILRTEDLNDSVNRLAAFLGVSRSTISLTRANVARRYGIVETIPRDFIIAKCREHCSDLMIEFYGKDWIDTVLKASEK